MFPNLLDATKAYWRQLDELEAAYQQGEISLDEVDARVAELMAELGRERRAALAYVWYGLQHWLTGRKEPLISAAILVLATYAWLAYQQTNSI